MVIQRKQSLFLLIAAILMGIYAFMALLINAKGEVILGGMTFDGIGGVIFILNCLVALLSFVTIFKFKSMRFQKKLCIINILLIIASLATTCTVAFMQEDCDLIGSLTYFNILPIVAIIAPIPLPVFGKGVSAVVCSIFVAFVVSVSDFSDVLFFSAHDIVDTSNVSGSNSASAFFITTLLYVKCVTIIPSLNTVNNFKLLYHIFS